jgi:Domain of unknown function (DUF4190)
MTDPNSPPPPVAPAWTPPPLHAYGYPYQLPPRRNTSGLAIASMIVSILGLALMCGWGPLSVFISPVGAVLGHVARRKLKTSGEQGAGMALAGVIVGWIGFGISLALIAVIVYLVVSDPTFLDVDSDYDSDYDFD